jgi:signal transduction histidine kinase/PAS domain-containing protein
MMEDSSYSSAFRQRLTRRIGYLFEQRWLNIGLRAKMGALVTVGLIGLMTIFAFLSISTAAKTTQQVINERVMFARTSALAMDTKLKGIENILTLLAGDIAARNPQVFGEDANPQFLQYPGFEQGVYLLDTTGQLQAQAEKVHLDLDLDQVIAAVHETAGTETHIAVISTERRWILITIPVLAPDGSHVGAVAALIDSSSPNVFPFVGPFELGKSGVLEVVDQTGLILFSTSQENAFHNVIPEGLLNRLFVEGKPALESCLGCTDSFIAEQAEEIIAFAPLSEAPWGVVIRQKTNDVFASVRSLILQTLVLGFSAIAGALVLVWVTTSSIINPVQTLNMAAERISEGDLATPVISLESRPRSDEIGVLALSFDSMRAGLKQSMDEIQAWNQELDARVQERTQAALAAQMEAQAARDDLRAVIDAISDNLIVIGVEDKRIQLVNRAAADQYRDLNNVIGMPCADVLHRDSRCIPPDGDCPLPQAVLTGKPVKVTHVHTNNGQDQYIDIVASPMRSLTGEVTRIIELSRDVTEEKLLKESLVKRNQQLSILNSITSTISQTLNLEDILKYALDEVLRLTEIDVGAVFLLDEPQENLKLMACRGLSDDAANLAAQMGMLDTSCGGVIEKGEIVVVPSISRLPGRRARSLRREKVETLMHIPLIAKGSSLGSICVGFCKSQEFQPEDKALLGAIGKQIAVAIENARLYAEVQHKEQIVRELFKKSIDAQEEERKRIARELHDDTSQTLAALLFAAEDGLELHDSEEVKEKLQDIRQMVQTTIQGVHKLIFDLRPSLLDHLGLVPALRWFAGSRLGARGIRIQIEEISEPRRLPSQVETVLYRVLQEAITNIARHAAARNVALLINYQETMTSVTIEDDGIGFYLNDLQITPDNTRGLGLLGMQERLELIGGDMEINAVPGQGTQLYIWVPTEGGA